MSNRRVQSALLAVALGLWGGAMAFAQAPAAIRHFSSASRTLLT